VTSGTNSGCGTGGGRAVCNSGQVKGHVIAARESPHSLKSDIGYTYTKKFSTVVPFGTVLHLRTTSSQNCEAVPRRARI